MAERVLLTGATGFVGRNLAPALEAAGVELICGSRDPARAAMSAPGRRWVRFDVGDESTHARALEGVHTAYYLVHAMAEGGDYSEREQAAARAFVRNAADAGVKRIIYLGGISPSGPASRHLRSRLLTSEILRRGKVPTVELRAGMIIGGGSESWRICRDLAMRLPFMVLPEWLKTRSQPIAIDDVVVALVHGLRLPDEAVGCYDLPGPEILSGIDILTRVAALCDLRPVTVEVPFLSPRLSSYWLRFVTRADYHVASELVLGLTSDLVAGNEGFWRHLPEHQPVSFEAAARRGLDEEAATLGTTARVAEEVLRRLRPRSRKEALSS